MSVPPAQARTGVNMTPDVASCLTRNAIDVSALTREVEAPRVGAISTFIGVVRSENREDGAPLTALEYTAHEPMALAEMRRLSEEIAAAHAISAVRAVHLLGTLTIGEASVAVVVSAPHRAAALAACREIIERLKADAPIFKREIWQDGMATWVNSLGDK